jgi:hypothetical protein
MAKYLMDSLVGHNGLGMEAGPCNLHFTGYAHPQALVQVTWPMQTLNPMRPTMAYYMWRNVATVMDDFHPAAVPVDFGRTPGLLSFTFRRGEGERMVAVWIDGAPADGIKQTETEVLFPGFRARSATAVDIMNGTEQDLDLVVNDRGTVLNRVLIKDYPLFVRVAQ